LERAKPNHEIHELKTLNLYPDVEQEQLLNPAITERRNVNEEAERNEAV
jgi:hypothetical protein